MGVELEVQAGRHIEAVCLDAVGIALTTGQDVTFVFNDTPVTVTPHDDFQSALQRYWRKRPVIENSTVPQYQRLPKGTLP